MAVQTACPDLDALQRYAFNQCTPDEGFTVTKHMIRCVVCKQTVDSFKDAGAAFETVPPPRDTTPAFETVPPPRDTTPEDRLVPVTGLHATMAYEEPLPATPNIAPPETRDLLSPPQSDDEIGRLGPYRVLKVLGTGGMGMVFLAEDINLQRKVALKAMRPNMNSDEVSRKRFLQEARAAAALDHDHIVTIYQVGEDRNIPFLAMQFLQGETVEDRLRREKRISVAETIRIGMEAADGLAAAHSHNLIHRDIKPSNIWLDANRHRVKILDFGLARPTEQGKNLTQTGFVVGTAGYMSPEQARGMPLDGRSDLFSLGCVLFEMCTGRTPFQGSDTMGRLMALALEQPPTPHSLQPDVPKTLSDLIMWMLAKRPEDRPSSAKAVIEQLTNVQPKEPAPAPHPRNQPTPANPPPKPVPQAQANETRQLLVAVLVTLFIFVVALYLFLRNNM